MSGVMGLALVVAFALTAACAIVPERIAGSHMRMWRRIGVNPAEPDGFTIAMYRIVGIMGMVFVAILAIADLAGLLPPAGGAA
ncbi:hypothetical protein [Sphingomonas sp. KR3-1]|uniref:hypothetical protein n=1 Tax=Sphingomonas sp. KR3-1 TaxID=3156611 RepID=UPI0032B4CB36